MKIADLDYYCCPGCRSKLSVRSLDQRKSEHLETGHLSCTGCNADYPVIKGIPRFFAQSNYADSFGIEWHLRARTQLDKDWQNIYVERFYSTTEFPEHMEGEVILEVGCGAGAFTGIVLATGAKLFSFDLSNAVEVCKNNHLDAYQHGNLSLCQASIYDIPFSLKSFDKIFCLGVLQHTPDPKKALFNLAKYLKKGGELVVDCYQKQTFPHIGWHHTVKHTLRIVTKRLPPRLLFGLCNSFISISYDVKAALNKTPLIGQYLHRLIPIGELQRYDWTPEQMKEIKSLNVFDMLSPRHDHPQSVATIRAWLLEAGLDVTKSTTGYNGVNAKAQCKRDL